MADVDPELDLRAYNGDALVTTATAFLAISYFSVFLRSYVRAFLTNGFQADDWLMIVAQFTFTLSCSFILIGVQNGLGHHNRGLTQTEEIAALKWQALATATYVLNMMFIKLSIGIFLLRLATTPVYKYIIWGSMAVIAIWSMALFLWDIFQCAPVEAQWDFTLPNQRCVSPGEFVAAAYSLSFMTITTDWLYALLPIPMIWSVKMSLQAKITVSAVLSLGIFASVATLVRLKFLADLNNVEDLLWAATDAMVWTLVEPGVAITAASLVTIRPLLRAWKLKGFAYTGDATYGSKKLKYGPVTNFSQKPARRNSNMPGFGNEDVSQGDVELGDKNTFFPSVTVTAKSAKSTKSAVSSIANGEGVTEEKSGSMGVSGALLAPLPDAVTKPNKITELATGVESKGAIANMLPPLNTDIPPVILAAPAATTSPPSYYKSNITSTLPRPYTSPITTPSIAATIAPTVPAELFTNGRPGRSNSRATTPTSRTSNLPPPISGPPRCPLPTPPSAGTSPVVSPVVSPVASPVISPTLSPTLSTPHSPRRTTLNSETYIIEGERIRPSTGDSPVSRVSGWGVVPRQPQLQSPLQSLRQLPPPQQPTVQSSPPPRVAEEEQDAPLRVSTFGPQQEGIEAPAVPLAFAARTTRDSGTMMSGYPGAF